MPADLLDQMYCSQQILIPPSLPSILKQYAKAAIRTQPRDLLLWSFHYFKAIEEGLPPPAKERIEYPPIETESGLTPGFLKVLLNQIGKVEIISKQIIIERWEGICLERKYAELIFKIGNFKEQVEWAKFVAIAAGTLENNLTGTMSLLCELLTEEPEGASAMIPVDTFLDLYKYLARLDCGPTPPEDSVSSGYTVEVHYSSRKETDSEELDDLLKNIGARKSALSVATDDLKEVDSTAGLAVWPDIVPHELQLEKESLSHNSDDVDSTAGLPVWNEEELKGDIGILEVEKGGEETNEGEKKETEEKDEKGAVEPPKETAESTVTTKEGSEDKEEEQEDKKDDDATQAEHLSKQDMIDSEAREGENVEDNAEEEKGEETKSGEEMSMEVLSGEAEKQLPEVEVYVDPNSEMIVVPTPQESVGSICSEEKSISTLENEKVPSIGEQLHPTTSLPDVKIRAADLKSQVPLDEDELAMAGRPRWVAYVPGIGAPVPDDVIEKVEIFLREVATKQCGMVMPRNLRHFLCPSLDGLQELEESLVKLEEDLKNKLDEQDLFSSQYKVRKICSSKYSRLVQ